MNEKPNRIGFAFLKDGLAVAQSKRKGSREAPSVWVSNGGELVQVQFTAKLMKK